jgi:hypothetical protein
MIVFAAIVLVVSVALLLTPQARPWWREILLGLRAALIETPLRAVTGRKRMTEADYRHLRELEIECGLVEAPPKPKFAGGLTMAEFGERLRQFGTAGTGSYRNAETEAARQSVFSGVAGYWTAETAAIAKESQNGAQGQ